MKRKEHAFIQPFLITAVTNTRYVSSHQHDQHDASLSFYLQKEKNHAFLVI